MFAVLQFPIADLRSFVDHPYTPLRGPSFPNPAVAYPPSFIKAFGAVDERRLRADPYWNDEWAFCRANRALRFPLEPDLNLPRSARPPAPRVLFKRLYSNGNLVNRVEVGFDLNEMRHAPDADDWAGRFRAVLVAHAEVRTSSLAPTGEGTHLPTYVAAPLVKQGFRLARLYADSTSRESATSDRRQERSLVETGQPMLVVECEPAQFSSFAAKGRVIPIRDAAGVRLSWALLRLSADQDIGIWLIGRDDGTSRQRVRAIRLSLLRLHASRQCLDAFLRQWLRGQISYAPGTPTAARIDDALRDAARAISRPVAKQVVGDMSGINDAFAAMSESPAGDQLARLEQQLEGVRGQTAHKVLDYEAAKAREAARPIAIGELVMYREGDIQVTNNGDNVIMQVSREGGTMENVSINVNKANADQVDAKALDDALEALATAIMESDSTKKLDAVTAVGKAKEEGTSKPDKVVEQIAKTGKILTETNTTIEQGKKLWSSVKQVADVLAPVVGAAALIGKLFGLAF